MADYRYYGEGDRDHPVIGSVFRIDMETFHSWILDQETGEWRDLGDHWPRMMDHLTGNESLSTRLEESFVNELLAAIEDGRWPPNA